MSRPNFTAALIGELRSRVIAHNETFETKVKLGDLRKLYERGYKGEKPAERAMRKVDDHLAGLSKAFNSDEPRDEDGKFKAAAGAAIDAASAAAAGVKHAAHHAAYQAGLADEPLKAGIKIPKKVPLDLPRSRDVHRALQADNAGYKAFTSDVLPEKRFEAWGSAVRSAVALTGGLLVAKALNDKNPDNAVRRAIVNTTAMTPALAAKVAVGVPLHMLAWASEAANKRIGYPSNPGGIKAFAYSAADKTDAVVRRHARFAIDKGFGALGAGVRRTVDVIEGRPELSVGDHIPPGSTPSYGTAKLAAKIAAKSFFMASKRGARRAAAKVAVVAIPAFAIERAIAASPFDPYSIGQSYDNYTYRVVQKALALPETEVLRKDMTLALRKSVEFDGLQSGIERLSSHAGRIAVTGLGSLAGAAIGAVGGAGSKVIANTLNGARGNPYHDKSGKFTSKQNSDSGVGEAALAGAAIGASLGAGAAHFKQRAVNRVYFRQAMAHLDNHVANLTDAAHLPPGANHAVAEIKNLYSEMQSERQRISAEGVSFIEKTTKENPKLLETIKSLNKYGAAHPDYYKAKIREDVQDHLANILKGYGVRNFTAVSKQDIGPFSEAIKNLSEPQKAAAIKFFNMRQDAPKAVDDAVSSYQSKIEASSASLEEKRSLLEDATRGEMDAKAVLDLHPKDGEEKNAAVAGLDIAAAKNATALKEFDKVKKSLEKLKSTGPVLKSPIDGKDIPPPTDIDIAGIREHAIRAARFDAQTMQTDRLDKVSADYGRKIAKARNTFLHNLGVQHAANVGAFVALGRKAGALEGVTGDAVKPLLKAHAAHVDAEAKFQQASDDLAKARGAFNVISAKLSGVKGNARVAMAAEKLRLKMLMDAAEEHANAADLKLTKVQQDIEGPAKQYLEKYAKFRLQAATSPRHAIIPPVMRDEIVRDVKRAAKATYDPISQYAIQPTASGLRQVVKYMRPHAANIAGQTASGIKRTLAHATGHVDPNTKEYTPDATKLFFLGASGAISATGLAALEVKNYLHARLNGDKTVKAPTNFGVTAVRHPFDDGQAMLVVHAANPADKKERIVIAGQRSENGKTPKNINPGARLNDVLEAFRNRTTNNNPNGGNVGGFDGLPDASAWLPKETKDRIDVATKNVRNGKTHSLSGSGASVDLRKDDVNDGAIHGPAGEFMSALRKLTIDKEGYNTQDAGQYHAALSKLFSKQSAILKAGQVHKYLTGYDTAGQGGGKGLFKSNDDFKSTDKGDFAAALLNEVSNTMSKKKPQNDAQLNNLRRAVIVVGHAKGISSDDLKPIFDKINGESPEGSNPEKPSDRYETKDFEAAPFDMPIEAPRDFSNPFSDHADVVANQLGPKIGMGDAGQKAILSQAIVHYSTAISKVKGYDVPTSMMIVKRAFEKMGGNDKAGQSAFKKALIATDTQPLDSAISREVAAYDKEQKAEKADFVLTSDYLNDLNQLAKLATGIAPAFPAQPKQSTGTGVGKALFDAQSAARNFEPSETRGLARAGQRVLSQAVTGAQPAAAAKYSGADLGAAGADLAGGIVAGHVLNHVLKTPEIKMSSFGSDVKSVFSGGAKAATGNVLKLGVKGLASSAIGSGLYNSVQSLAGGGSYRRTTTPGEAAALGAGNFAGSLASEGAGEKIGAALVPKVAGSAIGRAVGAGAAALADKTAGTAAGNLIGRVAGVELGPVGSVIGGAIGGGIGGALGEAIGHFGFKAFQGYDPKVVSRIMKTKITNQPPPASHAGAAQAGEIGGGLVGYTLGGAVGEGLGSALGGASGIKAAQIASPNPSLLPRRPSAPGNASA